MHSISPCLAEKQSNTLATAFAIYVMVPKLPEGALDKLQSY